MMDSGKLWTILGTCMLLIVVYTFQYHGEQIHDVIRQGSFKAKNNVNIMEYHGGPGTWGVQSDVVASDSSRASGTSKESPKESIINTEVTTAQHPDLTTAAPISDARKPLYDIHDSSQPCTFGLLREAYKNEGYFPSGGEWLETKGVPHYQPKLCTLKYPTMPEELLQKCQAAGNLSYVVSMGDSTGKGHYSVMRNFNNNCQMLDQEWATGEGNFIPDPKYFAKGHMDHIVTTYMKAKFRYCSGCNGIKNMCSFHYNNRSHRVEFEHVPLTQILDNSLRIEFPSYHVSMQHLDKYWALTYQEVIFRYYFKTRHPDFIVIYVPFMHAKQNIELGRVPLELAYFTGLVKQYLPRSTKVIYMPSYSEFEQSHPDGWKNRLFEGMKAAEKIEKMNRILYNTIEEDLINPDSQIYGFFDLFEVSKSRGAWSVDGVHMKAVYYRSVMSVFWETYCNSVFMDRF